MRIILHIGPHRTGTTSQQAYIRHHVEELRASGIGYWGPQRTRKGLFAGIQPTPGLGLKGARRARGRIQLQLDNAARGGVQTLLISDENLMGSVRQNIRSGRLYRDVGQRLSRYIDGFDGTIDKVVMSVRAIDHYWASTIAYGVARGHVLPDAKRRAATARAQRSWRDVISDVACAVGNAQLEVVPFEAVLNRPDVFVAACTGQPAPPTRLPQWLNRSPNAAQLRAILEERGEDVSDVPNIADRWNPFDFEGRAALRETYADDMHWLTAGADGLATLTKDLDHTRAGQTLPHDPQNRGQGHDKQERRLAQPG